MVQEVSLTAMREETAKIAQQMSQQHRAFQKDKRFEKENLSNVLHQMSDVPMLSDLRQRDGSLKRTGAVNSEEELERKRQKMEYLKFRAEQKGMLQRREQISKKVESMQREYNFIEKLTPDDVGYIMDQKRAAAARVIQNGYRQLMQLRRKQKAKMNEAEIDLELQFTSKQMKAMLLDVQEDVTGRLRLAKSKFEDKFYEPIEDEQQEKNINEILLRREIFTPHREEENEQYREIDQQCQKSIKAFYDNYLDIESKRIDTIEKTQHLDVMLYYLERQDIGDPEGEKAAQVDALVPWERVCQPEMKPGRSEIVRVEGDHKKRLDWYRKRKPWEAMIQEDEMDLEAERVLAEIQNYKQEVLFNMDEGGLL